MKPTKQQQERARMRKKRIDVVMEVYRTIVDNVGPIESRELAAKVGITVQQLSGRIRTANSYGAGIAAIYPSSWGPMSRVAYQCAEPINLESRMLDTIDALLHGGGVPDDKSEYEPGIHETPTGRIYAYADLKPPKADGYINPAWFGVGSSLNLA